MVQCLFDVLDVLPEKDNLSQKLIAPLFSYPELGIESRPVRVIAE